MTDTEPPKPSIESLSRVAKIPMVESAINKTSEVYGMLKGASETVNSVLTSAENVVRRGVETATPVAAAVASTIEGPIKRVDSALCSGLDYVEQKVPAIKLPPNELAQKTKDVLNDRVVEPAWTTTISVMEYGMNKVASLTGQNGSSPQQEETEKK